MNKIQKEFKDLEEWRRWMRERQAKFVQEQTAKQEGQ